MSDYKPGQLAGNVHVVDDDGHSHAFGPESRVPEWAAKKITNRRAWATAPTLPTPAATVTDPDGDGSSQDAGPAETGEAPTRPPNSGKGAGRPEWAAFATHFGVEFTDNDNRDAIRAKVEAWEAEQAEKLPAEDDGEG